MSEEDPSTIPEGKEEEGKESESEIKNEEQIAEEKEEVSSVFEFLPKELLLSLISPSSLSDSLPLDDIDKYIKRIDEEIVKTEVPFNWISILTFRNNFFKSTKPINPNSLLNSNPLSTNNHKSIPSKPKSTILRNN